jgi:hypothetical protein
MLRAATIEDTTQNIVAPSVYINEVVVENNHRKIAYSLIDEKNDWMTNEQILNNLSVYITDGFYTEKKLLKDLLITNKVKNNTISNSVIFNNTGSDVTIKAWCGNSYLSGTTAVHPLYISGSLTKASYENAEYKFINKNKDLDILNFNIDLGSGSVNNVAPMKEQQLYVSYRADKKANFGFIFDVESYLENNSREYNLLKNNISYKQTILAGSIVSLENSYFKKRNLTKNEKESIKINNRIETHLINSNSASYYVCVADDNTDISNRSYYDVEVYLEINDFSKNLLSANIIKQVSKFLEFAKQHRDIFI